MYVRCLNTRHTLHQIPHHLTHRVQCIIASNPTENIHFARLTWRAQTAFTQTEHTQRRTHEMLPLILPATRATFDKHDTHPVTDTYVHKRKTPANSLHANIAACAHNMLTKPDVTKRSNCGTPERHGIEVGPQQLAVLTGAYRSLTMLRDQRMCVEQQGGRVGLAAIQHTTALVGDRCDSGCSPVAKRVLIYAMVSVGISVTYMAGIMYGRRPFMYFGYHPPQLRGRRRHTTHTHSHTAGTRRALCSNAMRTSETVVAD